MSGLGKRGEGLTFLHVANGRIWKNTKDAKGVVTKEDYDWITGTIVGIALHQDTFEGNAVEKVRITMLDKEGKRYALGFSMESYFTQTLFSRLCKIQYSTPVTIGVNASENNEKVSFAWLRAGDDKVEKNPDFPKPTKVKVGSKELLDYAPVKEAVQKEIERFNAFATMASTAVGLGVVDELTPAVDDAADAPF